MQARSYVKIFTIPMFTKGLVSTYINKLLQVNKKINNSNFKTWTRDLYSL